MGDDAVGDDDDAAAAATAAEDAGEDEDDDESGRLDRGFLVDDAHCGGLVVFFADEVANNS